MIDEQGPGLLITLVVGLPGAQRVKALVSLIGTIWCGQRVTAARIDCMRPPGAWTTPDLGLLPHGSCGTVVQRSLHSYSSGSRMSQARVEREDA
jgi:hypothetical protein